MRFSMLISIEKLIFFFLQDFVRGQTLWSYLFIHTFPSYHSANHRDVRMIVVIMNLNGALL